MPVYLEGLQLTITIGQSLLEFLLGLETHYKKTAMKMPGKPSVVAPGNLKLGTLEASLSRIRH